MNNSLRQSIQLIGILIAFVALVIAILTWLVPFEPVGPSPFSPAETTRVSAPTVTVAQPTSTPLTVRPSGTHSPRTVSCLGAELIAFTSNRDGNDEIYVMNIDGSCMTRLTNDPASDLSPSWSPDGKRIAFTSDRDRNTTPYFPERFEIYTMNSDGTGVTRLTFSGGNTSPAWSPDGLRIAYIHSDVGSGQSIEIISLRESSIVRLSVPIKSDNIIPEYSPAWSPNGRQLAFISDYDGCQWGIYVMNVDGTNLRRITQDCFGKFSGPAWSPDGRSIAFGNNSDAFAKWSGIGWWQLYIMTADGSDIRRITQTSYAYDSRLHPTWSPNSKVIAFVKGNNERHHICIIDINTSYEKCLTQPSNFSDDLYPSWRPHPEGR